MRIAFIVPYVPSQVRTRPYNLVAQLSGLGHDVDVYTVGTGEMDRADADALKACCRSVYYFEQPIWRSMLNSAVAVPTGTPLQSVYSLQPDLVNFLIASLERGNGRSTYDVIHVEHLRGSEYGRLLKARFPGLPVVWDSVDCISYLFRQAAGQSTSLFGRLVSHVELSRTERAEARLLTMFDHVLVSSALDRKALIDTVSNGAIPAPISILANGVDQDHFRPNSEIPKEPDTLVFSGKMSYHANVSMVKYLVREIMPLIWQRRPNVRLFVVGKDPTVEIKRMMDNPLIRVTGTVSDIRPFLWRSAVAVAPLVYGAGIQNKILEAMAVGLPVVTTSKALLSLTATPGVEILKGDTPHEFSEAVLNLLENPRIRLQIGEAGRQYVQTNHNWRKKADELSQIYSHSLQPVKANGSRSFPR